MHLQSLYSATNVYNKHNNPSFSKRKNENIDTYKACVAANIWEEKVHVPTPESKEQEDALKEILRHRANMEKFVRISNDEFRLRAKIAELEELQETDPKNPRVAELEKELKARGNLSSVLSTIEKQKADEIKRNQASYKYLTDLDKLTFELLDSKALKSSQIDKFYHNARKHGLNPDSLYNAKELLLILSGEKVEKTSKSDSVSKDTQLSEEEQAILSKISSEYEFHLRSMVNIFDENKNHSYDVTCARRGVYYSNIMELEKHKPLLLLLEKEYAKIEAKYQERVANITPVTIWSPEEIWQSMNDIERAIGITMVDVSAIKKQLQETPDNLTLQKILPEKVRMLESYKTNWGLFLEKSIEVEEKNLASAEESGVLEDYKYLTEENSTIKRHKELYKVYKENGDMMPDAHWLGVLAKELCHQMPTKR